MNEKRELESRVERLENELQAVYERNRRVELDKAWEVSISRKVLICFCTYGITAAVFYLIEVAISKIRCPV